MDESIADIPGRKLGKRPADIAELKRTIWLEGYLSPAVPPPDLTNRSVGAGPSIKTTLGNDQTGNCVICEMMHFIGVETAAKSGVPAVGTTDESLAQYKSICGWRGIGMGPGCDIGAVLGYFRDKGITVGGKVHKIDGYVAFDWTNADMWKYAIYLFGGAPIGIQLPNAWYQAPDGGTWDTTNTRTVGGHGIPAIDYNATGPIISTWGGTRQMTWAAATSKDWVDEAYVALSPDWYGDDKLAPCGLNVDALKADLELIKDGQPPIIAPTPPPWLDLMGGGL